MLSSTNEAREVLASLWEDVFGGLAESMVELNMDQLAAALGQYLSNFDVDRSNDQAVQGVFAGVMLGVCCASNGQPPQVLLAMMVQSAEGVRRILDGEIPVADVSWLAEALQPAPKHPRGFRGIDWWKNRR